MFTRMYWLPLNVQKWISSSPMPWMAASMPWPKAGGKVRQPWGCRIGVGPPSNWFVVTITGGIGCLQKTTGYRRAGHDRRGPRRCRSEKQ